MNILLISPALASAQSGNSATAQRWANILTDAGHLVSTHPSSDALSVDEAQDADMMLALHAWRSADCIEAFHLSCPEKPIILTMTGTDIYKFQHSHPETVRRSMQLATRIIGLHPLVIKDLPEVFHHKYSTVYQSTDLRPHPTNISNKNNAFQVCVIGHLREEKDSLRAAYACHYLPEESNIQVINVGKAHNKEWAQKAQEEMKRNPRFRWQGEIPHSEIVTLMNQSQLMVISSIMEGGANVVSEACVLGLPILASDIPGNRGLLGDDYEGYFPVGDGQALSKLLLKAERSASWLAALREACSAQAIKFSPDQEKAALLQVISSACC